jgi:hypothetical protein
MVKVYSGRSFGELTTDSTKPVCPRVVWVVSTKGKKGAQVLALVIDGGKNVGASVSLQLL